MAGSKPAPPGRPVSASISDAMVRLVAEFTGRGPTRSRTHITPNAIFVVLEDILTKGEQSLVRDGRTELVLATRKAYQETMRADATELIQRLTGRTVSAMLSDNHIGPDVAVEIFLLAPEPGRAD